MAKTAASERGGFPTKKYVSEKMKASFAGVGGMSAKVSTSQDRYSLVSNFSRAQPKHGKKFRGAKPWGQTRKYAKAFWVQTQYAGLIPMQRSRGKLRAIYGPSVPRELERELERERPVGSDILRETGRYAEVRVVHHLTQVAGMTKSKYKI